MAQLIGRKSLKPNKSSSDWLSPTVCESNEDLGNMSIAVIGSINTNVGGRRSGIRALKTIDWFGA
jgi:hypothetical protein